MLRIFIYIPLLCLIGLVAYYLKPEFNSTLGFSDRTSAVVRHAVSVSSAETPSRSPWYTHELLLILMGCFILKTAWDFFERRSQNNPYGNYLEELPVAHRWTFFLYIGLIGAAALMEWHRVGTLFSTVSILCSASFIRKYFCDGGFTSNPNVKNLHQLLLLLSVLAGLRMSHPNPWGLQIWLGLMFCIYGLHLFYNQPDWMEHRDALFGFFKIMVSALIIGGGLGFYLFHSWGMAMVCGGLPVILILPTFFRWIERVFGESTGSLVHDIVFSEGSFAEAPRPASRLPSTTLLNHWINTGKTKKAWQTAKMHLHNEPEAVPIWLFAMKVAVLHLKNPKEALTLLKQFIHCTEIHHDHRSVAVAQMAEWMSQAGHPFNPKDYEVKREALKPNTLFEKVDHLLKTGDIGRAEHLLSEALRADNLNEQAFIRLVRLYAQYRKDLQGAERLIESARHYFSPTLLEMLSNYIQDWHQLAMPKESENDGRIKLVSAAKESEKPDPIEEYLKRIKESEKPHEMKYYSDTIERALAEHRYGTAIDLLKEKAKAEPDNFVLWLRYAETYAVDCCDFHSAEKILRQMGKSRLFSAEQMDQAKRECIKWQERPKGPAN